MILTFNDSIAPTAGVIGLWVNGAPLGYVSLATSLDGRTWTLNQPGFPAGSVVTMSIHGVMDITGNPLPDFSSQFTTVTPDTNAPTVVSQRPGNGATGVLSSSNLVLLVSEPLNPATVNLGSVHVTQNGLVVPGTVTLQDGSEIVFQPATAWAKGVQIAVQLDPTIQDLAGNALPTYQGLFTTQADPAVTPPSVVVASMGFGTTNAAFMLGYNEALNPATVTSSNVGMSLNCAGPTCIPMATVPTLDASGTVITLQPVDANGKPITLPPNFGTYYIWSTTGIQNTSGVAQSSLYYAYWSTGAGPDLSIPVVTSVTPSNGATGVGNNAQIVVRFSKPVAVATVTPLTVTLKNGTTTLIEGSMGFTGNGYHQELVVTPQGLLPDGATVTLTLSGITDEQGHPITPVTSSFVVGTGSDLVLPAVTLTNPIAGTIGIPTNQVIVLQVNKPIDPVTVNASTVYLAPTFAPSDHVAVTYTVSADGKTLTVSPTSRLMPGTSYVLTLAGPTDQVGNLLSSSLSFTTGIGTQTSPLQVLRASPGSGATGVPLNSLVDVQLSGPVNPGTIGAGSVSVTSGGVAVAGKLSLSADLTRLTFTPNGLLTAGANYLVTVAGFADAAGNAVVSYSTGFTAGSTSSLPAYSALSVVTWSPGSGSTGVSPTAPVVITFSSAVDPATVNAGTVFVQDLTAQFSSYGQGCCVPVKIPATITVNGNVVTLTPVTAWPGSATLQIAVAWTVTDLAGNSSIATGGYATSNFVTAVSTSSVTPTVTSVTPANGATGVGLNQQVILTFNDSIAPTAGVIGLWVNGAPLGYVSLATSLDGRTWTLNQPGFPAGSVVTMSIHGVMDITGNPLPDFSSQFTTVTPDTNAPTVVSQRPGNGATGVLSSSNLVLLVSEPLNPATVNLGSVHVTQNGLVVPGTVTLQDGSEIVFQPATAWAKGVQIAVQLDPTIQDLAGNALPTYQGLFTTQADPAVTPPSVVVASMGFGTTNAAFMLGYNEALNPATVTSSNVGMSLNCAGPTCIPMATVPTLDASGTVITLQPVDANGKPITLPPNFGTYYIWSTTGIQNTSGVAQSSLYYAYWSTGAGPDLSIPVVTSVTPSNGATGVGNNAQIVVRFSKPVAVATVTPLTVTLKNGTTTLIEGSMGFTGNGYHQELVVTPQGLLPDGATVTLTLSGITDEQGHPITPVTSSFVVGTGSDLVLPAVTLTNPIAGTTNVPTNAAMAIQFNKVIDPATVTPANITLVDTNTGTNVAVTLASVVSTGTRATTVSVLPSSTLITGHTFTLNWGSVLDYVGNSIPSGSSTFTTGAGPQSLPLSVLTSTPISGASGVALNTKLVVSFSAPIDRLTTGKITLMAGTTAIPFSLQYANGDAQLTITPVALAGATSYTLTIAGVTDLAGNSLAQSYTLNFLTGTAMAMRETKPSQTWIVLNDPVDSGQQCSPRAARVTTRPSRYGRYEGSWLVRDFSVRSSANNSAGRA